MAEAPLDDANFERLLEPDEAIKRFHTDLRDANTIVEDEELGMEAIGELVEQLDEHWPYLNTICEVSGRVYETSGEERLLKDERLVSLGAGLPLRGDDDRKIYHFLGVMEEGEIVDKLWVDPDEDSVHIQPLAASEKAYIQELEYYYPELKERLDEVLLNSSDVVAVVKELSAFEFEHDPEKVDPNEFRGMIEGYLNKLLTFKDKVPYSIMFKGLYFAAYGSDGSGGAFRSKKALAWQRRVAWPSRIVLLSVAAAKGNLSYLEDTSSIPALIITGVNPDIEGEEEDMLAVPISHSGFYIMSNMERVRQGFEEFELPE